ncbi:MAG: glycosyltransferase [Phycisphaerales bacterium]|nr:glycosyltransferase [Phycisphaerales bacterium]
MKILHVTQTMDPAWGGPPAVVMRLAGAQALAGHQVTVVSTPVPGRERAVADSLASVPGVARAVFHTLPVRTDWNATFNDSRVSAAIDPLVRGADFVHLHEVWPPILVHAARACRAARKPYCVTPHSALDPWALTQRRAKKWIGLNLLGYRAVLRGAAFFHALTRVEEEHVHQFLPGARAHIVPNGVFLEEFSPLPAPGAFRAKAPALGDKPFILFLSRLHYKKGLDYLADAFKLVAAKNPDVMLAVVGPDGGALADFNARIAAANLTPRVHVHGPVYGKDKFAAFIDAACFCLPSRMEGFSIAITEALACATPVVISAGCNFPEVADVDAGYVVDLTAQNVADACLKVLADPYRAKAQGARGREMVIDRFTWPSIAARLVNHYQQHAR